MRKNKETILLARIRRLIREAIRWNKIDDGCPKFYILPDNRYKYTKLAPKNKHGVLIGNNIHDYFYYTRSARAIEDIAKKIVEEVRKDD